MINKMKRFIGSLMPVGLAGAFLLVIVTAQDRNPDQHMIGFLISHMIPGWLLGVAALGLIRLFRVAGWAYPFVGLLVGPFIAVLFVNPEANEGKWGEIALVLAILGAIVGLIECARVSRVRQEKFDQEN